ncbi:MAG: hypothetical protein ACLUCU_02280, partial [Slackia sp.]
MRERRKTPNSAAPIAVEPPIESGASPMRRHSKKKKNGTDVKTARRRKAPPRSWMRKITATTR